MCMHNETLYTYMYLFIYTFIWGWICIVKCVARMIFFSRFSTNDLPHINHDIEMSISNALSSSNDGNWGLIDFENNPIVFLSLFLSHSHPHHFCFSVLLNHSIIRWKGHNLFFCFHLAPSEMSSFFVWHIFLLHRHLIRWHILSGDAV